MGKGKETGKKETERVGGKKSEIGGREGREKMIWRIKKGGKKRKDGKKKIVEREKVLSALSFSKPVFWILIQTGCTIKLLPFQSKYFCDEKYC